MVDYKGVVEGLNVYVNIILIIFLCRLYRVIVRYS